MAADEHDEPEREHPEPVDGGSSASGPSHTGHEPDSADGSAPTSQPEPRDPRDVLRDHPFPLDRVIAADVVAVAQVDMLGYWLERRIRRHARTVGLDPDELRQEVWLRLIQGSTTLDPYNSGARTWLARNVDWAATSILRSRSHSKEKPVPPDDLTLAMHFLPEDGGEPEAAALDVRLDAAFFRARGMSANQAEILAYRCQNHGMPLKDLAELLGRSYGAVRQELRRGRMHALELLGLNEVEQDALRAHQKHGTSASAAAALDIPLPDFARILERARTKIDRSFGGREGPS